VREVLTQLDRWLEAGRGVALATLVEVRGSAPRQPGARLCATAEGEMVGSVSAGCVESDVVESARRVLASGRPELVTYGISKQQGFEVGLSCGGEIDVLVEPFAISDAWRAAAQAVTRREPVVLAEALAPDELRGAKLALLDGGRTVGSIEPSLDEAICAGAEQRFASDQAGVMDLCRPGAPDARVFLQPISPPLRLFIVGGNHTAISLCRMAKELGYRVTLIDPRSAFATAERFPDADERTHRWPDEVLSEAELDGGSYVVTLTHDEKFDIPSLSTALRSGARYLGALGSRRTHAGRLEKLRELAFSEAELERIHGPIGLDLGGRAPEEIALAILAEMQAVRYGRDPRVSRPQSRESRSRPCEDDAL